MGTTNTLGLQPTEAPVHSHGVLLTQDASHETENFVAETHGFLSEHSIRDAQQGSGKRSTPTEGAA